MKAKALWQLAQWVVIAVLAVGAGAAAAASWAARPPSASAPRYLCGTREQDGKVTRWGLRAMPGQKASIEVGQPTAYRFVIQDEPCEWMRGRR